MNFADLNKKHNGNKSVDWGIDTSSLAWIKVSDLPSGKYQVQGVFNMPDKSGKNYGTTPCVIIPGKVVYLPTRYEDYVTDIINEPELVEKIKAGRCVCTIEPYETKSGTKTFTFEITEG